MYNNYEPISERQEEEEIKKWLITAMLSISIEWYLSSLNNKKEKKKKKKK
jgi:hypothetical protein